MSKSSRLLALAIIMVAATTTAAQALPLLVLGVAFASAAGAAVTLGASLLVAGLVGAGFAALSYVAQSASASGSPNAVQSYSKMQSGGVIPQSFIFGTWATAGSLVYFNYWGQDGKTPNAYESRVTGLSDLPSTALLGLIVNDNTCTYGAGTPDPDLGYPIPEFDKDGQHYLWVKFYDGTQTAADPFLVSKFSGDTARPYAASRKGTGRTYVVTTIRTNDQSLTSSSTIKYIVKGAKWYDLRKDSTAGGSGAHRFDDQSTWEYAENPQLVRYMVRRGISYDGQWLFGLQGMSNTRLPFDNWTAAFNDCDALVTNSAGQDEPMYRCGGEVTVTTEPAALDESLMRACNARSIEMGGIYKTITGVVGAPIKSYSDADFLITSPKPFNPYPGLGGTVNGITPHFPDPSQNWAPAPAAGRFDSVLEVQDGNRQLIADVDYDCVPFAEQVQRNSKAALDEERRWRTHVVVWPHTEWQNEPGDSFLWNSARNGYIAKQFRIESIRLLANRDLQATVREVDPADYDFDPDTDYIAVSGGTLVPNPIPPQPMVNWNAEGIAVDGDDGRQKPAVLFTFTTEDIDDVDGIIFEIRKAVGGPIIDQGESPHSVEQFLLGEFIAGKGLSAGSTYEARGKYRPISARPTNWSLWIPLTTPDVRVGAIDLYNDAISRAKLDEALRNLNDFVGASARDLLEQIQEVSQAVSESGLGAATDMQSIRQQLTSTTNSFLATVDTLIYAATGPDSAIAGQITTLTAALSDKADASAVSALTVRVTDTEDGLDVLATSYTNLSATIGGSYSPIATVADALSAHTTAISANADAITDVETSFGTVFSSVKARFSASSAPGDASARIAFSVSASDGGPPETAAFYMDALTSGGSRILLVADQVSILSGTDSAALSSAFQFVGGTLFVRSAVIPNLDAGKITTGTLSVSHIVGADLIKILTYSVTAATIGTTAAAIISTPDLSAYDGWRVLFMLTGSGTKTSGRNPDVNITIVRDFGGGSATVINAWSETNGNTQTISMNGQASDTVINGHAVYSVRMASTDNPVTLFSGILTVTLFKD